MDWSEVDRLKAEGKSYTQIAELTSFTIDQIKTHYRARTQGTTESKSPILLHEKLLEQLKKPKAANVICDKLGLTERMLAAALDDLSDAGYVINNQSGIIELCKEAGVGDNTYAEDWKGDKIIRRAIISDTHLNCYAQQLTHLNTFYDIVQAEGITEVLHAGDFVDGETVYPGHRHEVFNIGADKQKDYAVKNYPRRKGIVTKGIAGNHDLKYFTESGYDICKAIAQERDDYIYLGQYYAEIKLTPNCIIRLEHPLGKPAYAVSYKTQRKIDNMRGGCKPNILVEGHYHYSNYMFRRNVHAFNTPSFQGPTKFSNRLGLENENGGYIFEAHVDDEGTITRLDIRFIPFYKVIENDY